MNEEPADDVVLLPCPHCGGEASVSLGAQGPNDWWYIECDSCAACCDSVESWNRRTPLPEARRIVERHRRHVELSPGVGEDVQRYALAVCDDILADLPPNMNNESS